MMIMITDDEIIVDTLYFVRYSLDVPASTLSMESCSSLQGVRMFPSSYSVVGLLLLLLLHSSTPN